MDKYDEIYYSIYEKYYDKNGFIKNDINKENFVSYFFKEKKKIIEWNKKTNILKINLFNLSMKSDFKIKLDDLFINNILTVIKYLDKIIRNGWQFGLLTIDEYNSIVYFADFCTKALEFEKKKNFSNKDFKKVENSFLKITFDSDYITKILFGLKKILKFYKKLYYKDNAKIDEIYKNIENFFTPNYYYPSFYDLVLAYNIVVYKKYLEWNDLINTKMLNDINKGFYDCPKEIFIEIIKYIEIINNEIINLNDEKKRIEWIKDLSEINKIEGPELIKNFYNNLGHDWDKDSDDLFILLILLIQGIINKIEEIINKQWQLMDKNEKVIKKYILNNENISKIIDNIKNEYDLAKAKHLSMIPAKIQLKEFIENEFPESLFKNNDQKYFYEKISKIFLYLKELAIIFKEKYEESDVKSDIYLNYMVIIPKEWSGKAVFNVFLFYIKLFLQICGYFKEKNLILEIKKLADIKKKLKQKKEKIEKIRGNDNFIKNILSKL